MANIKIEIVLDTINPEDQSIFTKLSLAFGNSNTEENISGTLTKAIVAPVYTGAVNGITDQTKTAEAPKEDIVESRDISTYTEDELKAMPNSELKNLATSMGIDWESMEGKNTNAKLAKLIVSFGSTSDKSTNDVETTDEESEEEKETPVTETKESLTINDLKLELGVKVDIGDNREKIVAKLSELGASKLTNLDPSHFSTMMDFLKNL